VKDYGLRSINSLVLFGIRKKFMISGRSLLLYHFKRRAIKLTAVIIVGIWDIGGKGERKETTRKTKT
jgi:hypothetical protein